MPRLWLLGASDVRTSAAVARKNFSDKPEVSAAGDLSPGTALAQVMSIVDAVAKNLPGG